MSDLLKDLLAAGAIPENSFPPTSRYVASEVRVYRAEDDDRAVPYLSRRLCPDPGRFATVYEISIGEGDRRDNLADEHIGDVELWWRLADANGAIDPRELTDPPGKTVRITLEVDVPGGADD